MKHRGGGEADEKLPHGLLRHMSNYMPCELKCTVHGTRVIIRSRGGMDGGHTGRSRYFLRQPAFVPVKPRCRRVVRNTCCVSVMGDHELTTRATNTLIILKPTREEFHKAMLAKLSFTAPNQSCLTSGMKPCIRESPRGSMREEVGRTVFLRLTFGTVGISVCQSC